MRRSQSHLAIGGLLVCTTLLVWLSAYHLAPLDWTTLSGWRSHQSYNATAALVNDNEHLREALDRLEAELAQAKAFQANLVDVEAGTVQHEEGDTVDGQQTGIAEAASGYAYVFYATSDPYACSVLVNIHRLQHVLGASYPVHVLASSDVSQRYMDAFRAAGAITHIEQAPPLKDAAAGYYQDCMLKLLAFKMQLLDPSLKRVLAFDSDQLVMRNLDHLFTGLPDVDLAAPRAYWLAKDFLASTFLLINLSDRLWKTVKSALDSVKFNTFDMDLINELLGDQVMMLSGEYVTLNSHWEDWNLPKWFHPTSKLNMTTVEMWNDLAKLESGRKPSRRRDERAVMFGGADPDDHSDGADEDDMVGVPPQPSSVQPIASVPAIETFVSEPAAFLPPRPAQQDTPLPQPALPGVQTAPRFPSHHPLTAELYRLQNESAVIHFTAQGKPWMKLPWMVRQARPDAHPALAEQFEVWRETAEKVCPGGVPT